MHQKPHFVLIFAAVLLIFSCRGGGKGESGPRIFDCSPDEYANLGVIEDATKCVDFVLRVANAYGEPYVPLEVQTRCRCLKASTEAEQVAKDGSLMLSASLDPSFMLPGNFMEEVQVLCKGVQSGKMWIISLIVMGNVSQTAHPVEVDHPYDFGQHLHLSHEVLQFGTMEDGVEQKITVKIASSSDARMDIGFELPAELDGMLQVRSLHLDALGRDTLVFRLHGDLSRNLDPSGVQVIPTVNGIACEKPLVVKHFRK